MPPRPPLNIEKLSDNFGQFVILLTCRCGQSRDASPQTFARILGWDAALADVVKKLRCSYMPALALQNQNILGEIIGKPDDGRSFARRHTRLGLWLRSRATLNPHRSGSGFPLRSLACGFRPLMGDGIVQANLFANQRIA